jgi:hypothetical protein
MTSTPPGNSFESTVLPESLLFRVLSAKSAAEPGRWRTQRTPYLQEIMDCLSVSSPVQRVVFMKGAQVGGTEAGNNWIGYVIHMAPGPMMAVSPTVEMAKRNSPRAAPFSCVQKLRFVVRPAISDRLHLQHRPDIHPPHP